MKVIIPLAGMGTRLRPHTYSKPKPLVPVGGKPMLGHILDKLVELSSKENIEQIIFITGPMEEKIQDYVNLEYSQFKTSFIKQKDLLGDGYAVLLAKNEISTEDSLLIIFADTLFKTDLSIITSTKEDGIVWTKQVKDPRRFGVVVTDENNIINQIVEKPEKPISNKAIVGLYYIKDAKGYMNILQELIDKDIRSKGELRNADALSLMLKAGKTLKSEEIEVWADCGTVKTLLNTNRWLLETNSNKIIQTENSIIIEPVYIEEGVKITNSVIGPYVTIAKGSAIDHSIIQNSIINATDELIVGNNCGIGAFSKIWTHAAWAFHLSVLPRDPEH